MIESTPSFNESAAGHQFPPSSSAEVVDQDSISHERQVGREKLIVIYQVSSMFTEIKFDNN